MKTPGKGCKLVRTTTPSGQSRPKVLSESAFLTGNRARITVHFHGDRDETIAAELDQETVQAIAKMAQRYGWI